MLSPFIFVLPIFCLISGLHADGKVPEKFLGSFKLEKSENFDEYLSSRGISWFLRKLAASTTVTKIIKELQVSGTYSLTNDGGFKSVEFKDWSLDVPFEGEGLDGSKHKITFALKNGGNELTERHLRLDNGIEETFYYTRENDYLVMKMTHDGITAKRWFKFQP